MSGLKTWIRSNLSIKKTKLEDIRLVSSLLDGLGTKAYPEWSKSTLCLDKSLFSRFLKKTKLAIYTLNDLSNKGSKALLSRNYLACNDLKATARQILLGYRLRWSIEIFHKEVKQYLGFRGCSASKF